MKSAAAWLKRLATDIDRENLLPAGCRIVVAVSGGSDSVALLCGLHALNQADDRGWYLHAAHLDHRLRGQEAEADAWFVRELAERLQLPSTVEAEDVRLLVETTRGSPEEVARNCRYAFLERVCLRTASDTIAVGHQADDNAETILHRIVRGTGFQGLAGMRPERPLQPGSQIRLVRPLLGFRRQDILEFLESQGQAYRRDVTNETGELTRSRIRTQLLPMLAEINPAVVDALLRLADQARWVEAYLQQTAERTLETLVIDHTDRLLVLNARALAKKQRIIQSELIRQAILGFRLGEQDLTFAHLMAVVQLVAEGASGKQLHLPGGLTVTKQYGRIEFSTAAREPHDTIAPETTLNVPGRTVLPMLHVEIETAVADFRHATFAEFKRAKTEHDEWLDYDQLRLPLTVRSRRPGDRFWPLGAPGSKKVSDFLSDLKVPAHRREHLAVVCDRLGPVWVVPLRIDERVKLTAHTRRLLKLHARPIPQGPA